MRTPITEGMTPTQFLAAVNGNYEKSYGVGGFTTITNTMQGTTLETNINSNFSESYSLVGIRGISYVGILNNKFAETCMAFANSLSDYALGALNMYPVQYYNGKTYLCFQQTNDDPYIMTYTHSSGIFSSPVKIATETLPLGDGHGEPAMLIDKDGYIHIAFGGHVSANRYAKSVNPENITSWNITEPFLTLATYPQWLQLSDGTIYVFYRNGGYSSGWSWGYKTTSDGGANWSDYTEVLSGFSYALFRKGIGDTIHCAFFGDHTADIERFNVYYMYYSSGQWKNILGTPLTLPVTHPNSDVLVYNSGTNYTPNATLAFDSLNKPYILFTEGINEIGTYTYKFTKHNGVSWDVYNLGVTTDHWRDFATALDCISSSHFDTYIVTGGTANTLGGKIEKWTSLDGGVTWNKILRLTNTSQQFIDPILVQNYNSNAKLFFGEIKGLGTWVNAGCLWGDNGFC